MTVSERFEWSIQMQKRHALDIYRQFWDVEAITEVDAAGDSGQRNMKLLDYSGIDKIVHTKGNGPIQVAQRFRQPYYDSTAGWTDADFSIRVQTYSNQDTEYDKLKRAFNGRGQVPSVYGFGRTPQGRAVARESGFSEFYLIDCQTFLGEHLNGGLDAACRASNGDGSAALYFDLDELDRHGCVIETFSQTDGAAVSNTDTSQ
jgi:hypothetical protein